MKRWFRKNYTEQQKLRRENIDASQLLTHGCVPMDDYAADVLETLQSAAVAFCTLWESGQMPVLKYDNAFVAWRDEQIRENEKLVADRITCTLPWQVLNHIDAKYKESNRLYWSQQSLGSCFPYYQKVYTQNGAKTIGQLLDEGKEFIVLSYSRRLGRIAAKRAYAYKTGRKPCVRITTDKGIFDATTDHPFMLRTGEFVKASELKVGMSLFHASTALRTSNQTHQCVKVNLCHKSRRKYLHRMIAEDVLGWDCKNKVVHHVDENALHNDVSNLQLLTHKKHSSYHAEKDVEKRLPSLRTPEYREKMRKLAKARPIESKRREQLESVKTKYKNRGYELINAGYCIDTFEDWFESIRATRQRQPKPYMKRRYHLRFVRHFGSYENYLNALKADNHRIISIESLGEMDVASIGVFDPEPDDKRRWSEHNFLICPHGCDDYSVNGVIVANCMGHADAFAHHSSTLYWIARGAPLKYCPINPVVTWAITKGGSLRGGQTVSEMAKGANQIGHFIERLVGTNNLAMPSNYKQFLDDALMYQSSIMFLDFRGDTLCDEIFACCAAGLSVAVGNSTAISGSTIDKNGIKVAVVSGNWAHATHFTGYRKVNGTEYIGWVNSHGARYKSSDEGEPADMCWMDKKTACKFCTTMHQYGPPYAVFPESVTMQDRSFYVKQQIPWPNGWRF